MLLDIARHLILPVASLGIVYLALYLRLMRDSMAEIWKQDFVRAARACGLPRRRLILRQVARNALLPVVTMLGLQFGAMLGGFATEKDTDRRFWTRGYTLPYA